MLTGRSPPEEIRSVTTRSSPLVLSAEIVSSPALTTNSRLPSRTIAPCEASEAPVPRPPVGDRPDRLERPVGVPVVDGHGVARRVVGGLVDVPDDWVAAAAWAVAAEGEHGRGDGEDGGAEQVLSSAHDVGPFEVAWSKTLRPTSSGGRRGRYGRRSDEKMTRRTA